MPATPEAIVGVDLEGRGFDEVDRALQQQITGWDKVQQLTGRVAGNLELAGRHIGAIAGVAGIGVALNQWVQFSDLTGRVAQNIGFIRGDGSYRGPSGPINSAAIATSVPRRDLASAIATMTGQLPGATMSGTGGSSLHSLGINLGTYSQAYGVDVGTLGQLVSSILLAQGQGVAGTGPVLGTVASQAQKAGMAGQTAMFLQTVSGVVGALGSMHPGGSNTGMARGVGALYGAAVAGNPAFRDPSTFGAGVLGLDSGISHAYSNPRLEAVMQSAGVGYWDQRYGLSGPHGRQTAQKLLAWSDRMYGKGSIEQDLFLRSNFGDVSADLLRAFSRGHGTYEQLLHTGGGAPSQLPGRAHVGQGTPGSRATKAANEAGRASGGLLDQVFGWLHAAGLDSFAGGLGMFGAYKLGRFGIKGLRGLSRSAAAAAAQQSAERAGAREVPQMLGSRLFDEYALRMGGSTAERAGVRGLLGAAGVAAGAAAMLPLDVGAFYFTMGTHGLDKGAAVEDRNIATRQIAGLSQRYGMRWFDNPKAWQEMRQRGFWGKGHPQMEGGVPQVGYFLEQYAQHARKDLAGGGGDPTVRFERSVKAFEQAVRAMQRSSGGRSSGAAFDLNQGVGASMVFASLLAGAGGGGGGGGGTQFASIVAGGSPSYSGAATGSGWSACTLTWYDPALGGTNSASGRRDPHSGMANGHPYEAGAMTCAAPPAYAFGTRIQFAYNGKTITCTVTDRGGAIQGAHFDLSRGAASSLGIIAVGSAHARFRVMGGKAGSSSSGGGGGGGTSGLPPVTHSAAARGSSASSLVGGGNTTHLTVNLDGRKVGAIGRLVRGRA